MRSGNILKMLAAVFAGICLCACDSLYPLEWPTLPEEVYETETKENVFGVSEYQIESTQTVDMQENSSTQQETATQTDTVEAQTDDTVDMFLSPSDVYYDYELAYKTGDYSALDENQCQTMVAALEVVLQCIDLSEYDQALLVHDYLTTHVTYGYSDNQYSEYGALVEHVAVCQGYAYAYKLIMDLLGIPCITLGGTADDGTEEIPHAWNMVCLSGNWYHVDVTWDDATTTQDYGSWCHLYFCVDDDFISVDHEWTYMINGLASITEIPEANDMSMYYYTIKNEMFDSQTMLEEAFAADFSSGMTSMEYCCRGFTADTSFIGNYTSAALLVLPCGDYSLVFISPNQN